MMLVASGVAFPSAALFHPYQYLVLAEIWNDRLEYICYHVNNSAWKQ